MNFKRGFMYILVITTIISMIGCGGKKSEDITTNTSNEEKITVAVSIVPQETFVKAVSGNLVNVITMIPPGNSPANYQPTPKQMTEFSQSKVYFSIGVPTEEANILPKIKDLNEDIKIVSLADKVEEVYTHRVLGKDEGEGKKDPHIWLSPKRVKVMIDVIKDELIVLDPKNKAIYQKNAEKYIAKLDVVDNEIKEALKGFKDEPFIIFHPAFGYFADDYGLKMVTIEGEGKKATAMKVQEIIDFAKKENIKFVFYQEEFDSQQAETIAKEIGGETVKVSPLAPDYIENLRDTVNKFKEVLK